MPAHRPRAEKLIAFSKRSLTLDGAIAAAVLGMATAAAGWPWLLLLVAFFFTGTALSRLGEDKKQALTRGLLEKTGARDAAQVLANGGVFAVAATASILFPSAAWMAAGAGAIATSAADTWATEVGTLRSGRTRSILTWRPVAAGTSGGVSLAGSAAALAGAAFIASVVWGVGWPGAVAAGALAGGMIGAFLDSVLGATVQAKRWCVECNVQTEQPSHDCGARTTHSGGLAWFTNDVVNAASSAIGAIAAVLCVR